MPRPHVCKRGTKKGKNKTKILLCSEKSVRISGSRTNHGYCGFDCEGNKATCNARGGEGANLFASAEQCSLQRLIIFHPSMKDTELWVDCNKRNILPPLALL